MSSPFDFDRHLTALLDEQAPTTEPDDLADAALQRTRHMRQLPGWATLERWLPMQTTYRFGAVPRTALILVILGVMLTVVSAIAFGQQPSPKLPPPLGAARNGLIAFDDGGDIWVVNPDGTGRIQLTTGPGLETSPVWSEDGTRIAYRSQQEPNGPVAIKVMDGDGSGVRTLVEGVTLAPESGRLSWSHDGRFLAYAARLVTGPLLADHIMVVPVAGGDPVDLITPGRAPTWSPDDAMLGYQSGGMTKDKTVVPQGLSVIRTVGAADPQRLDGGRTLSASAWAFPQWSPDGQRLTYHAQPSGEFAVIDVVTVTGGAVGSIGPQDAEAVWPTWSPDGSRIAYFVLSATDDTYRIGVVDPDGSGLRTLAHPPLGCDCVARWSPDATKVVTYQDGPVAGHEDTGGSLMVIDVDGAVPVLSIPITGVSSREMSWQRLAR